MGLSQTKIAKMVNVATQQVQKYEKGKNSLNVERLFEFSQILKVPVSYFFEGFTEEAIFSDILNITENDEFKQVSDRETIELLKSFKRIKDYSLRKRIADLMRTIAIKDM